MAVSWTLNASEKSMLSDTVQYITNKVIANIPSHTMRKAWYRGVLRVQIGRGSSVLMNVRWGTLSAGAFDTARVCIGSHTVINRECVLDGRAGLRLGNNVSVSPGVSLVTMQPAAPAPRWGKREGPIVIGDYAWLGSRAIVLPGVRIGEGAVVAAGSVVAEDVSPYTVVAGVPARSIATRNPDLRYELAYQPLFE